MYTISSCTLYMYDHTYLDYIYMYYFQNSLYEDLIKYRNSLAHEADIPPFLIASNKLLGNLSLNRPSTIEALRNVEGVSENFRIKFGPRMLERIKVFLDDKKILKLDSFQEEVDATPVQTNIKVHNMYYYCIVLKN